jgi:hypothetical protein
LYKVPKRVTSGFGYVAGARVASVVHFFQSRNVPAAMR